MPAEILKAVIQQDVSVTDITPKEESSLPIISRLGIDPPHVPERFSFRRSTGFNSRGSERFHHRGGRRSRCSECNGRHPFVDGCGRETMKLTSSSPGF